MYTTNLNNEAVAQLNKIYTTFWPGDRFALIATLALVLFIVLICCGSFAIVTSTKQDSPNANTSDRNRINSDNASDTKQSSPCFCFLFLLAILSLPIAGIAIIYYRIQLNNNFIKANSVYIDYSTSGKAYRDHLMMIKSLKNLSRMGDVLEIEKINGKYRHCGTWSFEYEMPKYLDCNLDIYLLQIETAIYYFFPDCLLMKEDGRYYRVSFRKVKVNTNQIAGLFSRIKYRSEMVHGRIKIDGGLDRRYKTRYEKVPYESLESLESHGVIHMNIDGESIVLLTSSKVIAIEFGTALTRCCAK